MKHEMLCGKAATNTPGKASKAMSSDSIAWPPVIVKWRRQVQLVSSGQKGTQQNKAAYDWKGATAGGELHQEAVARGGHHQISAVISSHKSSRNTWLITTA